MVVGREADLRVKRWCYLSMVLAQRERCEMEGVES